jgi:hypothetical protein
VGNPDYAARAVGRGVQLLFMEAKLFVGSILTFNEVNGWLIRSYLQQNRSL